METVDVRETWTIGEGADQQEVRAWIRGTLLDDYKGVAMSVCLWDLSAPDQVTVRTNALDLMERAYPDCDIDYSGPMDQGWCLQFHVEPREE